MVARSSLRACLVAGLPLLLQAFLLPNAGMRPAMPTTRSKVATYGTSLTPLPPLLGMLRCRPPVVQPDS